MRIESQRAESGSGFFGGGSKPLSHQLEGLGSTVISFLSTPAEIGFGAF